MLQAVDGLIWNRSRHRQIVDPRGMASGPVSRPFSPQSQDVEADIAVGEVDEAAVVDPCHRRDKAVAATETVWIQLPSARPSSRIRRNAAIWTLRLLSP